MSADLEHARERLKEWAYCYRDRSKRGQAGSAEGAWRSPQVWEAANPRPTIDVLRAHRTHELLKRLPTPNFRALTFRYCWPWLAVGIPLRVLSRRLGYRVNLAVYDHLVLVGEYRLAVLIEEEQQLTELRVLLQRAEQAAA